MSAPFFSIIIPTYNRATLIGRAIDSVLAQTFSNWEMIIVDDGSKDNTKEVVAAYTDPRIKYVYQQNAERCAARNNGISHAQAPYICFLDSDDYYLNDRLELLHDEMVKRNLPVAMFYTGLIVDKDGVVSRREEAAPETNKFDTIALATIHSQQVCIKKEILQEFKYDTRFFISEDMELWLRILTKYPITFLEQYTVVAVEHDDRSINVKRNSYADQLKTLQHVFSAEHSGNKISASAKGVLLGTCYYGMAKFHIYKGNRGEAVSAMFRTIMADMGSSQLKFRINVLLKLLTFSSMDKVRELIKY